MQSLSYFPYLPLPPPTLHTWASAEHQNIILVLPRKLGIDKTLDPFDSTVFLGPKLPVNSLLYLFPRRDTRLVIDVEVEKFFTKKR